MAKLQLIDLGRQYESIKHEVEEAVLRVLRGGRYILGPEVKSFEEEMASYCGVKHAIGVANGTDALIISLIAMGIGQGDEVITTPLTFYATAEAIAQTGARPVFVDIDPETYNIDTSQIEKAITPRTKAIMPVHLFGLPAEMDRINAIAKSEGIGVIEDACQAIGARHKGKRVGSLGDIACFSFFPTKNLSCFGDGGMVVTDNDELAVKVKMLRFHGSKDKVSFEMIGFNSRLDEVQAAVLRVKLKKIDEWNELRRQRSLLYKQLLEGLPVKWQQVPEGVESVYHLFIIQSEKRDELVGILNENGISAAAYYKIPLHLQEAFSYLGHKSGDFPVAVKLADEIFAVPLFPEITEEEVRMIAETIGSFIS